MLANPGGYEFALLEAMQVWKPVLIYMNINKKMISCLWAFQRYKVIDQENMDPSKSHNISSRSNC